MNNETVVINEKIIIREQMLCEPPRFAQTPEIVFCDGKAIIQYQLLELGDYVDQTEISWYRVDNIDRSNFKYINLSRTSNETDSRKVAITRDGAPCREIRLTSADVGKHIKVNIKPKHNNSETGQGLNIVSRIVRPTDVVSDRVMLNPRTVVVSNEYDMELGYFTVRGDMVSGRSFTNANRPALIAESTGCGIYYAHELPVDNMSLVVMVEPEDESGNGYDKPRQYTDIYIKYDPATSNGYALRIGETSDQGKTVFCLYQIKNGNGTPISNEFVSDAFKPGCEITLQVKNDVLSAFISYDNGEDYTDLELRAKTRGNNYGGFGFKYMGDVSEGYRVALKYMEAEY